MAPLAWIRRIAAEFPELKTIPLFGNSPPFDWAYLSSAISSRFGLPKIDIRPKERCWKKKGEIQQELIEKRTLPIQVSPLGTVYWAMSEEDLLKLTAWTIKPGGKMHRSPSAIFQEGFYRFVAIETLSTLQQMPPFTDLTLQIGSEEIPFESAFCIDVEIAFGEKSCWGRLVIPADFRTAWVQHFSHLATEYFPLEIARQTPLNIGIKTGSVLLHQSEWKTIKPGDFVLLDRGGYDAHKGTGICLLMLQSTPIFNAKIKQNKVELTDYAFYYEENMDQKGEKFAENVEKLPASEGEVTALKELPLYVTVEIARIKITLDQLMHLTPGNMLELPIHPDQGVFLSINGQKVGRAELVYLGEELGIRILEI